MNVMRGGGIRCADCAEEWTLYHRPEAIVSRMTIGKPRVQGRP